MARSSDSTDRTASMAIVMKRRIDAGRDRNHRFDSRAFVATPAPSFRKLTDFPKPNPAQATVCRVNSKARPVILEAKIGSGKTEAALCRHARNARDIFGRYQMSSTLARFAAFIAIVALTGCEHIPSTTVLPSDLHQSQKYGYVSVENRAGRAFPDHLIGLSLSGGGTRAAALAYGVLLALKETTLASPSGDQYRFIDEVRHGIRGVRGRRCGNLLGAERSGRTAFISRDIPA